MATEDKKYLDLTGLQTLVTNIKAEDAKRVAKVQGTSAHTSEFAKVTTDSQGLVTGLTAVTKSDITGLGIPSADTNQTVKVGSDTFGADDAVTFVGGTDISVVANTTNDTITINFTGNPANDNQKVKSGSVTFGVNDVIDIKADSTSGNPITVEGNATNKEITIKHGTTTAVTAAAVKVGKDGWGHVTLGDALTYTDIANRPTIGDATLTIQANGTSKGTFKANATADATINITAADLGLESAMHFIGVLESLPTPTTSDSYKNGDVVIVGSKEYVRSGKTSSAAGSWVELGDEGSHALKTISITGTNGLTGGGTLEANRTISHATTSAITAGAYAIGCDTYGHVVKGTVLGTASDGAHTHTVSGSVTVPTVSPTSKHLTVSQTKTTDFVTAINPTSSKLVTTTVTGVSGSTSVYGVKSGTNSTTTASKASAGTAVDVAKVGSAVACVTGFQNSGVAYQASYDSTNSALVLTALTPSTSNITPAVSNGTITPWTFSDVTVPIRAESATTIPTAASSATTVATGSVSDSGTGGTLVTGFGTASTAKAVTNVDLLDTATSGGVTFVSNVSVGTESASLANGSAASNGAHTHTVTGGAAS